MRKNHAGLTKLLASVLAFIMCVSLIPGAVLAADEENDKYVYVRASEIVDGETYLIVNTDNGEGVALTYELDQVAVAVANGQIVSEELKAAEWDASVIDIDNPSGKPEYDVRIGLKNAEGNVVLKVDAGNTSNVYVKTDPNYQYGGFLYDEENDHVLYLYGQNDPHPYPMGYANGAFGAADEGGEPGKTYVFKKAGKYVAPVEPDEPDEPELNKLSITVLADKTTAHVGDTINYMVVLGAVENLKNLSFTLAIPAGLTFVSGNGENGANFNAETMKLTFSAADGYTSAKDTVLLRFSCKVNDKSVVGQSQTIAFGDGAAFTDVEGKQYDVTYAFASSAVKILSSEVHVHTEVKIPAVAPTCDKAGSTEGLKCSECGEILVAPEIIPALGHVYGNWQLTSKTYHRHVCERCGKVETERHNFGADGICVDCGYDKTYDDDSDSGISVTLPKLYTLKFNTDGGSVIKEIRSACGKIVSLDEYIPVKEGYTFGGWYADKALTKSVSAWQFLFNGTVYAKWVEGDSLIPAAIAVIGELPFVDVLDDNPFFEDVAFVYGAGLMNGVADDMFALDKTLSRAMIVTILYRLEGEPAFMNDNVFTDVEAGSWYEKAVVWANGKGIVLGYGDGTFGPNNNVTREQMAAILYRYAEYKGYDVSVDDEYTFVFEDAEKIDDWALTAMKWACSNKLIDDTFGYVKPLYDAVRSDVAVLLHRFCNLIGA